MTTTPGSSTSTPSADASVQGDTQVLTPNYRLAVAIALLTLPLMWVQLGVGLLVFLFGLFLIYQTGSIRLAFTPSALEVYRGEGLLKTFPYDEWLAWKVFWPGVPILFYFKEVNSIHFLPVLFSPMQLRSQLEARCSGKDV